MRARLTTVAVALGVFFLPLFCRADQPADDALDVKNFKHVRILIWSFQQASGIESGFAEAQVSPGKSVTVEPSPGYRVKFSAGEIRQNTVTNFEHEWKESAMPFTVAPENSGYTEGSQYLTAADVHVMNDSAKPVASIAFTIPIGSQHSPAVANLIEANFKGDLAEVEDLLIALVKDKQARPSMLTDVYGVLRSSRRLPQWIAVSKEKDEKVAFLALIAAARLGDPESVRQFCSECLNAEGNEQVNLAELLSDLPPSEPALDTMLQLMGQPRILVLKYPGVGIADVDRRQWMCNAVVAAYSMEQVRARVKALVDAAKPEERADVEHRLVDVVAMLGRYKANLKAAQR